MTDKIIAVYATLEDRNHFLGYAIGKTEDIEAFFDDQKCYGLVLENVVPTKIVRGYAFMKKEHDRKQAELNQEMKNLNRGIE